jgi:hypothetical protein
MATTMPELITLRGICGVCALGGDCELINGFETPVKHCEEFEPDPSLVREMVSLAILQRASVAPVSDPEKHMGLCKNCDHRENCAFPRNEGGVWYCEEYA